MLLKAPFIFRQSVIIEKRKATLVSLFIGQDHEKTEFESAKNRALKTSTVDVIKKWTVNCMQGTFLGLTEHIYECFQQLNIEKTIL